MAQPEPSDEPYGLKTLVVQGHGHSDKPRGDYTLGGYANGMRDVLTVLGINKVTVVGHSFGGGIAMRSPTSSPSGPSGWCWSPPGGSAWRCQR